MLSREKGSPPLYFQLKEELKDQIEAGKFERGDIFLSEKQLQEKYQVSRVTVRQAVNELVNAGYLQCARGVGTTVVFNKIDEQLKQVVSFSEEMAYHGIIMSTSYCVMKRAVAEDSVAQNLGLRPGTVCYCLERVRCAENIPIVYSISYLTNKYRLPLEDHLYQESLYQLLKEDYGIIIAKGKDTFEAVLATPVIGEFLNIKPGQPVFKRIRKTFDQDGDILEYTVCYYAGDKYKYSVDL